MELIETLEDASFRVVLKDWGNKWQCLFAFLLTLNWGLKKKGQQKKGRLILKLGVQKDFKQNLSDFFRDKND